MRALVFDENLRFQADYADPAPAQDEALVRVTVAGICNTDVEIAEGYMGFRGVLGHEFVGVVEQADDARWIGKRVVGDINCSCRQCPTCQAGRPHHCPSRTVLGILGRDGAFADRLCLPVANLHEAPDGVSDEEAVFVEPLAAAFEIIEQVHVGPGQCAAVLGDGKLGLLAAQVLAAAGCDLLAIGRREAKLGLLAARGIRTALAQDVAKSQFDVVVDCTGAASGFEAALGLVRPRGTLVLKSTVAGGAELSLAPVVIDEITIVGSRCGPFPRAIDALQARTVGVRELVSARYPLEDGLSAFDKAQQSGVIKVLLDIG